MTATSAPSILDRDRDARNRVLEVVLQEDHPAVVVDSPPGAGKTSLVEAVVAAAVLHFGMRVVVVAPRVEQVEDLTIRLRRDYAPMPIQLLHSPARPPSAVVASDPGVTLVDRPTRLASGQGVVAASVAKLAVSIPDLQANEFDLLVCDESYQVPWKDLCPVVHLSQRHLLVGDPGQLRPLVRGDVARYEAARYKVHWAAPRELLHRNPRLPRLALPATWRLPQDTVDLVQPSFYPNLPFASAASPLDRRIGFAASGIGDPVDLALDRLAAGATMVGLLLPAARLEVDEVDEELARLAAHVVERVLDRGITWDGRGLLGPGEIGYVDPHVASNARVRSHLLARGIGSEAKTDTPEIWQGQQRPVMVTKHTLSGLRRFDEFALDPGRLCVMASRHELGNILIGRDGVGTALDRHHHDCAERPSGTVDPEWAGWRAHKTMWETLETSGRLARI